MVQWLKYECFLVSRCQDMDLQNSGTGTCTETLKADDRGDYNSSLHFKSSYESIH